MYSYAVFAKALLCGITKFYDNVLQVSHLLAPSLDEPPEPGSTAIPCDRQDLFGRLVALLSFETVASDTVSQNTRVVTHSHAITALSTDEPLTMHIKFTACAAGSTLRHSVGQRNIPIL